VQLSISRCVTELARRDPDRLAVTDGTRTLTRAELDRSTNRLARDYAARGVVTGDLVTVALPNSVEFVEACVALWKLGAAPQPVSSRLPDAERDAVVGLANSRLVVGAEVAGRAWLPAGHVPDAGLSDAELPDAVTPEWKAPTSGGSTGRPKLIIATTPGVFDPDQPAVPYMRTGDVQLTCGPLYHNGPFIYAFRGLVTGHSLVVMPRFDAERMLALVQEHRIGFCMIVPTMMQRVWRLPADVRAAYDVSSLHTVLHLGAPCPRWLKQAWLDWLGPERVLELYAGTEANGITVITGPEWLERPGSVGRPALGSSVKVLHRETGEQLPPGEVGEVYLQPVNGPGTTYRYVGAEPTARDGFESLGDLGFLDADGYLYLTDRTADLVVSGGSNIYPAEVEAALDSHPAVRSSVVFGVPDDDLGERVHALVDAPGGVRVEELLQHVSSRLVRYKVPRGIDLVDEPLRDDAGKVRRTQVKAQWLAARSS
jgi:bile acid-coenzyme A ligase